MTKDLTNGNILGRLLGFTLPICLGNIFQQLYNMADSIIVGRFIGKEAFAAVGSTGSVNFLIIGFILGLCCGVCVPVSQRYGAGEMQLMRRQIAAAVYICTGTGLVMTVLTAAGAGALLRLMQTPENIMQDAYTYIFIIFLGIPATLLYNLPANISRALGDSRAPLYFLVVSALLNVVLDIAFVCGLHTGVEGTAIATVISQAFSGILCILYLRKKYEILQFEKGEWAFVPKLTGAALGIGLPMGFQFSITAIGTVVLQSAVNQLGSNTVAGVNAAIKIHSLFVQPLEALGATMTNFAGQNLGAKRLERVRQGVKKALVLEILCSVILFVTVNTLCIPLSHLFMRPGEMTPYIKSCMRQLLFFNSCGYMLLGSLLILRNTLQGLGHSVMAMGSGVLEMAARSVVAFSSAMYFGYTAICLADSAAWIAANLLLVPLYIRTMKKLCKTGERAAGII